MPHATLEQLEAHARFVAPLPGRRAFVLPLSDFDHLGPVRPASTNVGNGILDALSPIDEVVQGAYELRCTTAVAEGGVFQLRDPNGTIHAGLTMTPGTGASTAFPDVGGLHFRLTDGSIDFAVNDRFTFTPYPCNAARVIELADALNAGARGGPIWLHGGEGPGTGTWQIENPDGFERIAAARRAGVSHVVVWDYELSVKDHIARLAR